MKFSIVFCGEDRIELHRVDRQRDAQVSEQAEFCMPFFEHAAIGRVNAASRATARKTAHATQRNFAYMKG